MRREIEMRQVQETYKVESMGLGKYERKEEGIVRILVASGFER